MSTRWAPPCASGINVWRGSSKWTMSGAQLCRTLGRPHDLKGLEALLSWCDPQGTLAAAWAACTAAAINCRGLNDRNGALAGARLQNVQARLGVLIEGRRETVTYGPRGTCSVAATRQGLHREA